MKLTYLGTAAAEGWPAVFCNCPCCRQARVLGGKDIRTRRPGTFYHPPGILEAVPHHKGGILI